VYHWPNMVKINKGVWGGGGLGGQTYIPKILLTDPFWLRKITTDSHILAQVNIECPDDRYPKLKIYISELILNNYEYIQWLT
jgi:hypothetical protein